MKKGLSFLLEIGTEEIPARFFGKAIASTRELTGDVFSRNNIVHSEIRCFATPRRIIVFTFFPSDMQGSTITEVSGPPIRAAFDKDGNPTQAAEGFARAQGVSVADLNVKDTPKGQYISVVRETKGAKISKVLPSIVPEIISGIHFPKNMRWGRHTIRFVRPIRWILCLLGPSVIRFDVDGIKSGRYTFGHRLLSPKRIGIKTPSEFERVLSKHQVVVDHEKRKVSIEEEIDKLSRKSDLRCIRDAELIDTVNFLVEKPFGVLCSFPESYLKLPKELLITVMKDHQKYFAMQDSKGRMKNAFIVISNTNMRNAKAVRDGAEKVIRARFEDAQFYYKEDIKINLADRLELLKGITFHEKLGSLYDKVRRIKSVALSIADRINPDLSAGVSLVCDACKADLTTGVVREFPELQGITGYYYALHEGMAAELASAIREHYKPLNTSDSVPASDVGRIVSLADKMDSIVSFFSAGIVPSGSEDPYALRRQAQGIIQVLISSDYALTVQELINYSIASLKPSTSDFIEPLKAFLVQRVEYTLSSQGFSDDIVRSLIGGALDVNPNILTQKSESLVRFKKHSGYAGFITAIKRVRNILTDTVISTVQHELLREGVEKNLYQHTQEMIQRVQALQGTGDYIGALKQLETMTAPINAFFEGVLVMDKDDSIRKNRLALLSLIWDIAKSFCDFSHLSDK